MNAIIIDDELHSRETTRIMLETIAPEIKIIALADNAREGATLVNKWAPDLIFLDIQMPEINGIQMIDLIPSYIGDIIFITAYEQYAIEAFKKGALHYLLKPIDPDDLREALKRIKKKESLQPTNLKGKWLSLSTMEGWIIIEKQDIIRCESYKNYATIVTTKATYTISKTLKDVESKLPRSYFYRVHNSHIINICYIDKVLKSDGGNVSMKNGDLIPISNGKKAMFFQWFQNQIDSV